MTREELEKYISELSPEMQEKARQCKDMQELNALLAENDVELSEDALSAVAGGCSSTPTETSLAPIQTMINIAKDHTAELKSLIHIQKTLAVNRLIEIAIPKMKKAYCKHSVAWAEEQARSLALKALNSVL